MTVVICHRFSLKQIFSHIIIERYKMKVMDGYFQFGIGLMKYTVHSVMQKLQQRQLI